MRKCTDPTCPCQDGDACHYEAVGDTPAHELPPGVERINMDDRERIAELLSQHGIDPKDEEWGTDDFGKTQAQLGRWEVTQEDESKGLYAGEEGTLTAIVVGSENYGNQRVSITFTPEGWDKDSGPEVVPFGEVSPL